MARTALLAQNDNLVIDSIKQNVGRSVFDLSHSTTFPIDVDGAILPICAIECVPSDSFQISCECLLRQLSPLKVPIMTNLKLNTAFYFCDNRLGWKKWDRFIEGGRSGNEVYSIPLMCNHTNRTNPNNKPDQALLIDNTTTTSWNEGSKTRTNNINYKNSLHTYFGISHNLIGDNTNNINVDDLELTPLMKELPIAFPFFDYQIICRDFYTDPDRLADSPSSASDFFDFDKTFSDWTYQNLFPVDEDEIKLVDGIQFMSGFQTSDDYDTSIKGFVLDKVRYHNVRDDYFTTSKKAPMRGNEPSINLSSTSSQVDFSEAITDGNNRSLYALLGLSNDGKLAFAQAQKPNTQPETNPEGHPIFQLNDGYSTQPYTFYKADSQTPPDYKGFKGINEVNNFNLLNLLNQAKVNVSIDSQVTAQELRLLSQLTVWQELNMLHKPYYNDFLNAHFSGVRVGDSLTEKPQYIGGTSQIIHINEIQQTSASTESSALGTVGATAHSLENNYVGQFYCNSYGWIIGVAYIQVDMLYNPAVPRSFSRRTKEDFYFPEFANLSMQATLNKELFFSNDYEWNNTPWGYTGAFDELRSIPNHVAGDLLNNSYTDLKAWVLRREFANDNLPSMSTEFLSLKDNVDKTAWQVPLMPAFMLQAANYIKAVRPMPYVAIPKAL